jgi:hypothetical protein
MTADLTPHQWLSLAILFVCCIAFVACNTLEDR